MDDDVIARLYPLDNEEVSFKMRESPHCEVATRPSTSLPTPRTNGSQMYAIVLRHSRPPRGDRGFVFGRDNRVCDCTLPAFRNISSMHFAISYDEYHRLVLDDFSSVGTTVTYDNQAGERRSNFTWIVGEHDFVHGKRIIVNVNFISFEVSVPHHAIIYKRRRKRK